ncbi:prepilin-type N-terminal cleavage/methylation domain-containing protein [Ornithinibacillus sp. BX22]|uniref:Prepilin-type N-terminal cleavage/methylation domain-containing protein n=2 Tax=Ornithinibacillus TaxID=484508 RepID=A0A923L6R2_9BACI|nr:MULTISPECIES: prepilin-type N-terminal cleavage/methylation domain-containing protein [Ornithinibacillus]MBC5637464.1 prepilin-type N-terminal cleavage/methylation domain-containing protein [Ornithinibacillus hominis]MBS3682033.1 prepilin-type N-terminal cleavage/methylation domain-containing protein [Ornithinibacillus massiliensis]
MKNNLVNDKGMTLAELLVVLAISSFIMIILTSILLTVQNQYTDQSSEAGNLFSMTYASKVITKEVRMAKNIEVSPDHTSFIINDDTAYVFHREDGLLVKNDVSFVSNIRDFYVDVIKDEFENEKFILRINTESGKGVDTEIIVRGSD